MVFVGVRRQRRQNRRVDLRHRRWEQRFVTQIHQRLVGVIVQEGFHVLAPAHPVVQLFGVPHLVVIQILQQIEGEVFHLLPTGGVDLF